MSFAADISLSCQVPGLLVTCSSDDSIKFWDIQASNGATMTVPLDQSYTISVELTSISSQQEYAHGMNCLPNCIIFSFVFSRELCYQLNFVLTVRIHWLWVGKRMDSIL